ncbi:hypothetical protein AAIR98_000989 [Elusimicrobium simillimum]|uniref:hypothetical protein n=1 Tax=Elusimicrobium simillimum TaxID=3143438 RepID=UPI003C6F7F37
MLMDYSVIETKNPIARWQLQIIEHASDKKYYIIRQVEGTGPIYNQTFWNGRRNFFGEKLPVGSYTAILSATDSAGELKVLRRKMEITAGDTVTKTTTKTTAASKLNYKAKRLWTRPGRSNMAPVAAAQQPVETAQETPTTQYPYEQPQDEFGTGEPSGTTDPYGYTDDYGEYEYEY